MQEINALQLKQRLAKGVDDAMLLDVREIDEFDLCHIDGSINIPMGEIPQTLDKLNQTQEIVTICHHGMRSMKVAVYLEQQGFTKIINLTGGVDAWAKEVDLSMVVY